MVKILFILMDGSIRNDLVFYRSYLSYSVKSLLNDEILGIIDISIRLFSSLRSLMGLSSPNPAGTIS